MKLKRALALVYLASSCAFAFMAQAQQGTDIPAEFPPASYEGRQYVDSRGCVYVRAGIDGAVDWVPRVSRAREHLCGAQPTFAAAAPAPTVAPIPKDAIKIVPATTVVPAAKPTAAPQQPVRVVRTAPAPAPVAKPVAKTIVKAPASKPVAPAPKVIKTLPKVATPRVLKAAPVPQKRMIEVPADNQSACQGASAISNKYIGNGGRYPVRCGSQDTGHVTEIRRSKVTPSGGSFRSYQDSRGGNLPGNTVIVPKHVYDDHEGIKPQIPAGYRSVWEDDRLNPYRAYQTVQGYYDTQAKWTNTVPRRMLTPSEAAKAKIKAPKIVSR